MPNRRSPRNHPESMVPRRYHLSRPPVLRPARPENGVTTSDWLWNSNTYRHVQNTRRNRRSVAAQSRRAAARAARIQAARAPKPAIGRANQHWIWNSRTLRHIRNSASNRRRAFAFGVAVGAASCLTGENSRFDFDTAVRLHEGSTITAESL